MELLSTISSTVGSVTWGPLVGLSKRSILMLLERIETGSLIIETQDGETFSYGPGGSPSSHLEVKSDMFWVRLLLFADMGFSEAYMLGEVECSDLCSFFTVFIKNRAQLSNANTISSTVFNSLTSIVRSTNTMTNSLLNVAAHYDISNDMFSAFLTPDMTYSCALFDTSIPNDTNLEAAQYKKLNKIISLAKIKSTDHVLEIGTGWGSFAMEAVKKTGCKVTSLTLSVEQKTLAEKRIAQAGLADSITVLLCDYRALKTPKKKFDKVVSIEMLEAVGKEYLDTYFEVIHRVLKADGGIAVFQCITMPETRSDSYAKGNDFIRKYIFPGGYLPSHTQLVNSINRGSAGQLVLESVDNIGGNYTRTLRIWCEEFLKKFDTRIAPALKKQHPNMRNDDVEVFRRKWVYYFTYCEAGFKSKVLNDIIFSVGREGATELYEGIPL